MVLYSNPGKLVVIKYPCKQLLPTLFFSNKTDKGLLNATIRMLMLHLRDNKLVPTESPGFTNPIIVEPYISCSGKYYMILKWSLSYLRIKYSLIECVKKEKQVWQTIRFIFAFGITNENGYD